ncbi:DNA-directed RNA polymerase subunit delta [Ectobacillus antri]|uniref:Probable DNA-directed RNA polymerase subunit delta n=1 Tax=Ectobacillus antri TaxID=2486280 RepID=A0ABT6H8I8_9BACI|nr:DNA-directed RNA polymerase subunit delta [Ectobacillus antri]MDG4657649.1 DNA-directed RNA polymerase subunit delta [Ectobacillus antri]MDG5754656.1 DNA-directed RNA polymerase subunit delta [Ectobacillus antri]
MNLQQYSPEELKELSMIEVTYSIMESRKEAIEFSQLVKEISSVLNLSQEEVAARIAQFYTDLNIDGRFITIGENRWGLRSWYPYEQIDEEILPQAKPKKKRKYDEDEFDDFIVEDEDYEDLDEVEDLEDLDELDEDLEDLDEDLEEIDEEELIDEDLDEDEDFVDEVEYDEVEEEDEL